LINTHRFMGLLRLRLPPSTDKLSQWAEATGQIVRYLNGHIVCRQHAPLSKLLIGRQTQVLHDQG
jgi:hypothetical protein